MDNLEFITLHSCRDLSSLFHQVKNQLPGGIVGMGKYYNSNNQINVKKKYLPEFCRLFSLWLHKHIWMEEAKIIMNDYFSLNSVEQNAILILLPDFIKKHENRLTGLLYQKICIMLSIYPQINMEGFTIFCIKEYQNILEELIECCFEEYLAEKDYYEFIHLLQYYIEVEGYQFGTLNIIAESNGLCSYYDEKFNNITNECMEQFGAEFNEAIVEQNDCLITILIMLLPEKIRFYGANNLKQDRFVKTLKIIFGNRITFYPEVDITSNKTM